MIFFITVLRALAACLITNAHYEGIYPTDIIANGGLVGDVLFFAVSGYCLYNLKISFGKWYLKRLYRIYPPVLVITLIYMLLGQYTLQENTMFEWYIYPTGYHFVASIVVLYVFYYIVMRVEWLRKYLMYVMIVVGCVGLIWYVLFYDKTYYHIDTVREPFIRVLFFEAMLLGAWFRQNDNRLRNSFRLRYVFQTFFLFCLYLGSKLVFVKIPNLARYQIINQFLIFALLYFIFRLFSGLDSKLEQLPDFVKKVVSWVSALTLEIYVVQYVPIEIIREKITIFPTNWIVLTATIAVFAILLNKTCNFICKRLDKFVDKW